MSIKASNQISIVDVTDAYSVILTSESYTFVGGTNGAPSGSTCTTQAVAYCGNAQCKTVSVAQDNIVCPTGISASVTNNNTAAVTITFTTSATISEACEATIPVVVDDITVNKKFSFAVAKAGSNGSNGKDGTSITIKSTSVTYQVGTSGTTKPTGTWSESVPNVENGQYLWTKTVVTYSDGKSTEAYSVSYKGTNGTNGTNGTSVTVKSTSVTYVKSTSGTSAPNSGWDPNIPSVGQGEYLWTKTVVIYSDGKSTTSYSVSRNAVNGSKGADAITMSITSSAGIVFKNNSGSTVLTAHVYKAGAEQSITDAGVCGSLGHVKWYKGKTLVGTSKTLTVSASDVDNVQAYTCQLEA